MRKPTNHQNRADLTGPERAAPNRVRPLLSHWVAMAGHDENQLAAPARVRRPHSGTARADVALRIAAGRQQAKCAHIPEPATSHTEGNLSPPQAQQPSQQSICAARRPKPTHSLGAIKWAPPSPLRAGAGAGSGNNDHDSSSNSSSSNSNSNNNGGGKLFEQNNKKQQVAAPAADDPNWDSPRRSEDAISWRRRAQPAQGRRTRSRLTPRQTTCPTSAIAILIISGLLFCFTFCSCRLGAPVQSSGSPPSSASLARAAANKPRAAAALAAASALPEETLQREPTRLKRQLDDQDERNKKHRHNQHHRHYNHRLNSKRSAAAAAAASTNDRDDELKLSHHVRCEPISQVNDLRLACPQPNQFIVILEAYYSDRYPELACPRALDTESKLGRLSPAQLVDIFRQLYAPKSPAAILNQQQPTGTPIRWTPTLNGAPEQASQQTSAPFCLDFDLKLSVQAKCSGRRECRFRRTDHQFPTCVQLKPGHVFLRHLCVDEALLVRHCNANDLLASSGPLNFGFVMSPGYPEFYVTPQASDQSAGCGWRIGAQPGQRITVKLLDASLAPNHFVGWPSTSPELFESPSSIDHLPTASDLASQLRAIHGPAAVAAAASAPAPEPNNSTNILLEQLTGAPNNTAGLDEETLSLLSSLNVRVHNKRIVFKIDQHDYHVIKLNLALKLEQISNRCLNYDQLIVRDLVDHLKDAAQPPEEANSRALDSATLPASAVDMADQDELGGGERGRGGHVQSLLEAATTMRSVETFDNEQELELISKLPVSLYRNHLIDFRNETIFHTNWRPGSRRSGARPRETPVGRQHDEQELPRLDYKALLEGLNPLQLAWMYQHNVTLCSMSQLEQVSALQERQKVSFTSSANLIQLDLVAGRVFNPTNRGLLFWFHKHGCPQTRTWPKRSRLIFRNETLEVFRCLDGFVFGDTRQIVRQRECNQQTQLWFDRGLETNQSRGKQQQQLQQQEPLPACVFVEDLVQADNSLADGTSLTSKFERLIAATSPTADANQANRRQPALQRQLAGGRREIATEIVGSPPNKSQEHLLDFDIFNTDEHPNNQVDSGRLQPVTGHPATNSAGPVGDLMRSLLDFINNRPGQMNGHHQNANGTNSQLIEQRQGNGARLTSRWAFGLDGRLLVAVLLILSLFVLLNLIIYVIFLVAIPSIMRCLFCPNDLNLHETSHTLRNSRQRARRSPSTCKLTTSSTMSSSNNKLAHYESDYSVSMGMSL